MVKFEDSLTDQQHSKFELKSIYSGSIDSLDKNRNTIIYPLEDYVVNHDRITKMDISGNYFGITTTLNIGNVSIKAIIDTGSRMIVLPKIGCRGCSIKQPYYEPTYSSSLVTCASRECEIISRYPGNCESEPITNPCISQIVYSDGTKWIIQTYKDYLTIDDENIPDLYLGAIVGDIGHKPLQSSYGLLGLARCSGDNCIPNIIDTVSNYLDLPNKFGVRLSNDYSGLFTIGEPSIQWGETLRYTPILKEFKEKYFILPITITIFKSNKVINVPSDFMVPTIVDTGTSFSYFSPELYDYLKDEIFENCNGIDCKKFSSECFIIKNSSKLYHFPTIEFVFQNDAYLTIPPEIYFSKNLFPDVYCLGITRGKTPNKNLIGLSFMRENYIFFDNENNQVGFLNKELMYNQQQEIF